MAGSLSGEPPHHGMNEGTHTGFQKNPEESGDRWYYSRKEIEENSPSRRDGIDLKKETYLRKAYCTFLQDLGMRLKVPQVTIATAIIFSHRFFLRQSHLKNDRRTIATVCMFLACKVEETPRPLKDVILVSYEMIHKKDPAALQRIKQKDVYEQQKEVVLLGERVVLGTLGYNLNVYHPYKSLVEGIKKLNVGQNTLAQVAWNFVNDGLRTSLCLQFKPHLIAAGAIFLAAKFLKVKLPNEGDKNWWQEFDVHPRQLEEVSNQMLELYEQNRVVQPQASEAEGSVGTIERNPPVKGPPPSEEEEHVITNHSGSTSKNNDSETKTKTDVNDDEAGEVKDKNSNSCSPQDKKKKLDREKLKAAFERRKALVDMTRKEEPMDELERELEDVEIPIEKKLNQSRPNGFEAVEEGEVEPCEDQLNARKRKSTSPLDRNGYSEREHKRQLQENRV